MDSSEKNTDNLKILSADLCIQSTHSMVVVDEFLIETTKFIVDKFPSKIKFFVKVRVFFKEFNPNNYLYILYNKLEHPDDPIDNIEEHQGNISVSKFEPVNGGGIYHILTSLTGINVEDGGIYRARISMRDGDTDLDIDCYETYFIVEKQGK